MNIPRRKAVSPIIATLLLIAIAVAAGIIVYVFVGGLSTSLTGGGGSQVSQVLSMDAYNFPGTSNQLGTTASTSFLVVYLRNTGSSTFTIAGSTGVFYDGNPVTVAGTLTAACTPSSTGICYSPLASSLSVAPSSTITLYFASGPSITSTSSPIPLPATGTTHLVKIVSQSGGSVTFSVVAGSSG